MKMYEKELDEMQIQRRNRIGNQTLMVLVYLLLIDIALNGFGFRWLEYPTNVFVIVLVSMTYYKVRIIWNNAVIGPRAKDKLGITRSLGTAIIAILMAAATILVFKNVFNIDPMASSDMGAQILLILAIGAILTMAIATLAARRQNKDNEE